MAQKNNLNEINQPMYRRNGYQPQADGERRGYQPQNPGPAKPPAPPTKGSSAIKPNK